MRTMFAKHKHVQDWNGSGNFDEIELYFPAAKLFALLFYSVEKGL